VSLEDDTQHLKLLSLFHYIVGGVIALFSSLFLGHVGIGLFALLKPDSFSHKGHEDPAFGWLFLVVGSIAVLGGWSLATCVVLAGRFIAHRKHYMFCVIVAGVEAVLCNPFGTALGVFSLIVLLRSSVKPLFAAGAGGERVDA
jgi:hypothetical protein